MNKIIDIIHKENEILKDNNKEFANDIQELKNENLLLKDDIKKLNDDNSKLQKYMKKLESDFAAFKSFQKYGYINIISKPIHKYKNVFIIRPHI